MRPANIRHYKAKNEKLTVSIRLPDTLKDELEKLAEEYGYGFSEFIQDGLDQWAKLNRERLNAEKKK